MRIAPPCFLNVTVTAIGRITGPHASAGSFSLKRFVFNRLFVNDDMATTALNNDGTWKHNPTSLSRAIQDWLTGHGWRLP